MNVSSVSMICTEWTEPINSIRMKLAMFYTVLTINKYLCIYGQLHTDNRKCKYFSNQYIVCKLMKSETQTRMVLSKNPASQQCTVALISEGSGEMSLTCHLNDLQSKLAPLFHLLEPVQALFCIKHQL